MKGTISGLRRVLALGVTAGTLACGSGGISVEHDYSPGVDFRAYSTYGWSTAEGDLSRNLAVDPPTDERIRAAIDRSMVDAGLIRVDPGVEPDLTVGYIVSMEAQVVRPVNNAAAPVDRYGGMYDSSPTDQWFEEGTLEVGLVDPSMRRVVWKGLARTDMGAVSDGTDRQRRIDTVVGEIFKGFPPG